ncbi:Phosphopantothenoylcysteine decarboxylase [Phytophthora palmivora]|uniref:Phosphopantothenoylcysteine decarboxylase n=1 Tax=Phytophthora palmivora TaxID=4796 RepID=A0A2P4XDI6_9STRA|nr:Phosphopantothenoylcysteine decarboxylase [Phytophthora palmivora]
MESTLVLSRSPRVLLCASGSVATVKVPEIAVRLSKIAEVCVVLSKSADFFLQRAKDYNAQVWEQFDAATKLEDGEGRIAVVRDEDEWEAWNVVGDSVRHIELKDWADVMLLAPMSANTLGKLANGLADNLLTCIARAWIMTKPFVFAPAMNTDMWNHPITATHLRVLDEFGYKMVPPVEKKLACGVVGNGGLATVDSIVAFTLDQLRQVALVE